MATRPKIWKVYYNGGVASEHGSKELAEKQVRRLVSISNGKLTAKNFPITGPKPGAKGPAAHWLDMSLLERERTKQYIKEGVHGYTRTDGVKIPGLRRIYTGFDADRGFDLRHIERWSAAQLKAARSAIQSVNTLTNRPFQVLTPHNKKQKKSAQNSSGQNLAKQKAFIIKVQTPALDRVTFSKGQVVVERKFKSGTKQIKTLFLFVDYLKNSEPEPVTFPMMRAITIRMLPDMPAQVRKNDMYYTLTTRQYGPIGNSVLKKNIIAELTAYYYKYEKNTTQHIDFAEQIIGWTMVGNLLSAKSYDNLRAFAMTRNRKMKKLRFSKRVRR